MLADHLARPARQRQQQVGAAALQRRDIAVAIDPLAGGIDGDLACVSYPDAEAAGLPAPVVRVFRRGGAGAWASLCDLQLPSGVYGLNDRLVASAVGAIATVDGGRVAWWPAPTGASCANGSLMPAPSSGGFHFGANLTGTVAALEWTGVANGAQRNGVDVFDFNGGAWTFAQAFIGSAVNGLAVEAREIGKSDGFNRVLMIRVVPVSTIDRRADAEVWTRPAPGSPFTLTRTITSPTPIGGFGGGFFVGGAVALGDPSIAPNGGVAFYDLGSGARLQSLLPPGLTVEDDGLTRADFAGQRGILGVSNQNRAGVNHAGMVYLVQPVSMRVGVPTFGTVQPLALPPAGSDALFFDGMETVAYRAWRGLPSLRGTAGSGYPVGFAVAAHSPMIDWSLSPRVPEQGPLDEAAFRAEVLPLARPRVFRGLVAHWPAAAAAREGDAALCAYLRAQGGDAPVEAFVLAPAAGGRVFYADDSLSRLNYDRRSLPLAELLGLLFEYRAAAKPPAFYAGAVRVPQVMPGFVPDNPLPFPSPSAEPLVSLWIGNRTRVAAHWDLPSNLICVVGGRRRYILFAPQQIANLYPGPLEFTPAGQPVSLVDFHAPDLARFPRFAEAARHAQVAELGPGDALYLPSLWWHHAESLDAIGAMVNAWWREAPAHATTPSTTLQHALLTLRDLPPAERAAWRAFFDWYVFEDPAAAVAHLPEAARGILGEMTPEQAARLRAHIARTLQW